MFNIYFYPYLNAEKDIDGFQAHFINESEYDYLYEINYSSNSQTPQVFTSQVLSYDEKKLNYLKFDHLNESPTYHIRLWKKLTTGTGPGKEYTLKIKAKSFFKHKKVDSYTNATYYALSLAAMQVSAKQLKDEGSLKDYTKSTKQESIKETNLITPRAYGVEEKANFHTSIDLHIEMLTGDPGKMNSFEKLQFQIFKAKEYLEEAHMLGIEKVYLLHGVGKGRLKDELTRMLKSNPTVHQFKNEYHGSFGFGATEVIFKQ